MHGEGVQNSPIITHLDLLRGIHKDTHNPSIYFSRPRWLILAGRPSDAVLVVGRLPCGAGEMEFS